MNLFNMKSDSFISLNYIRGILSLWIIFYHLKSEISFKFSEFFFFISSKGYLAVDIFFIISGFVITYKYAYINDVKSYLNYLFKRIKRIYPLHIFTVFIILISIFVIDSFFGGEFLFKNEIYSLRNLILNIFLMHSWGFSNNLSWNIPSWSISTEFFTYLIFPFILYRNNFIQNIFFIFIIFFFLFVYLHKGSMNITYDFGLLRNIISFSIGSFIFYIYRRNIYKKNYTYLILSFLIILFFFINEEIILVLLLCPILMYILINSKIKKISILNYLGKISFSIYMNHWVILLGLKYLRNIYYIEDIFFIFLLFTLTFVISMITFEIIEKKFVASLK